MFFCDTSAIAKLYVAEKESPVMRDRLETEDQVRVSDLARTEQMRVFHRHLREKIWSRDKFRTAIRQFNLEDIAGSRTRLISTTFANSTPGPVDFPYRQGMIPQ